MAYDSSKVYLAQEKETAEECKARKAAKAAMKSTKTKAVKPLPEADDRLTGSLVTISTGSMVINCTDGSISLGTPSLVPVYEPTGKIVIMSQVPENLPPLPVLADIPKEKAGRCLWCPEESTGDTRRQ